MGEYVQPLVGQGSIYHFTQKAILKNTAGENNPVKAGFSGDTADRHPLRRPRRVPVETAGR